MDAAPPKPDETGPDDTARAILDAASRRFLHYGYGKTTMSEIAGDCNMSTGNLYRYFPSKLDIAEAFVRRIRTAQIAALRKAINGPEMPVRERLRRFYLAKLKLAYDRYHKNQKAFELSVVILDERPEFATDWEKAEAAIVGEILEAGEFKGEIAICNRPRTARIFEDATYRFSSLALFRDDDYEALAGELNDVLDLMLDGFAWRAKSGISPPS